MLCVLCVQPSLPADVCFVEEKDGANHGQMRRGWVNDFPHSRAAAATLQRTVDAERRQRQWCMCGSLEGWRQKIRCGKNFITIIFKDFPNRTNRLQPTFFFSTHQLAISPLCLNSFASLMTTSLVTSEGRQAARHWLIHLDLKKREGTYSSPAKHKLKKIMHQNTH